jgi:hypothetical protein
MDWRIPSSVGGMDLQSDNAARLLGRESHHGGEIRVQGHDRATVQYRKSQNLFVRRSREAAFHDGDGMVSFFV